MKVASDTFTLSSWAEPGELSSSGSSPPAAAAYTRKNKKDIWEASKPNKVLQPSPSCSFSAGKSETSRCVCIVYSSYVLLWKCEDEGFLPQWRAISTQTWEVYIKGLIFCRKLQMVHLSIVGKLKDCREFNDTRDWSQSLTSAVFFLFLGLLFLYEIIFINILTY